MNKTIRNLAIAALFIFPGLSGFPQGVQQAAAPVAPVSAQTAQAQADQLRAQAAQLQAQAAQLQAQAAQVQPVQALPVQQANPLAGLITMADAKRIVLTAAGVAEADARNFKVELDSEGVLMLYEVEFDSGFHEYEYKIDARTGAIVGTKKKLDIF